MEKGLITKKMSDKFWVKTAQNLFVCTAKGILKSNGIFVGENVEFNTQTMNIEKVLPRKNQLIRPPLVNLDQLFVLVADKPQPDFLMLDKLLLFCKVYDITPIICYTKIDKSTKFEQYIESVYGKFYKTVFVSAHKTINLENIKLLLKNKISAFAGQSGVGKSALLNALFGNKKTLEGMLSAKISRGKNTTRHCELFEFEPNSYIADTPGFSSLDEKLLPIEYWELPYYYPDFLEFLKNCKYKSCTHTNEQDCGIKKAVESGQIDFSRYERYQAIYKNLKCGSVSQRGR